MTERLSLVALFVIIASSSYCQDSKAYFEAHIYQPDTFQLHYGVRGPHTSLRGTSYPLVIYLRDTNDDQAQSVFGAPPAMMGAPVQTAHPCFLLAPDCPRGLDWTYPDWYAEPRDPMKTLLALLDSVVQSPQIDAARVYVIGKGTGGNGTWYLLLRRPELFAAAIPIDGTGDWVRAGVLRAVPIRAYQYRKNKQLSTGRMIREIRKSGGMARLIRYGGHTPGGAGVPDAKAIQWLFTNTRAGADMSH